MVPTVSLAATAAASLLLLPSVLADGLYTKSSPVLQLDSKSYDTLIAKSNHTSIVEFYAPWCGHCKNLQPAYEKAAKQLAGLAKVGAVNCDEESNKPFCGSMGVQGFPTLKIVKPGKKAGRPIVEDYQGARNAKGIVDAVVDKIPNHVKRLKDDDYEAWLEQGDGPKAILFSEKGTTSALLKAVAVDYLGTIPVAQIRSKETEAVEVFNVDKFPTLVLLPGSGKDPITYNGEMKKDSMISFLSQAAPPNPDPAPKKAKSSNSGSKSDKSKASAASSSFAKSSASQASNQAKTDKASQTAESMEDASQPTNSPNPNVVTEDTQKPITVPADIAPPIESLQDGLSLQQKCLNTKAGTCILALLPAVADADPSSTASSLHLVSTLSEIHHKHHQAQRKLFPFFQLPSTNSQAAALRTKLSLSPDAAELIALNGKRAWYRHYSPSSSSGSGSGSGFSQAQLEDWIDAIRMGDGKKEKVPAGLIMNAEDLPAEPIKVDINDPVAMKEALKGQLPEGVEFEFEEIGDEEYERATREAEKASEAAGGAKEEHDEL